MKKMYEWYIYKEKEKKQLRVILFVRFRIPHVFIHITLTSLTFKPSFIRGLSNPHIGLRRYLEKLKIRVETRYNIYIYLIEHYKGGISGIKRKSIKTPPSNEILEYFEHDLFKLIKKFNLKNINNELQRKLRC